MIHRSAFGASTAALFALAALGHLFQVEAAEKEPLVSSPSSQVETRRWVNVRAVNFRRGPSVNHNIIRVLTANEPVRILGRRGRWVQAEWVSGQGEAIPGWVYGRFLSENRLTQKELERLRVRSRPGAPGADLALLCLVAIPTIYLIRRGLATKRDRRSLKRDTEAESLPPPRKDLSPEPQQKFDEEIVRLREDLTDDREKRFFDEELARLRKDPRSALGASILCGLFGVDRFYLGQPWLGALKTLTFGGYFLWYVADWFVIKDAARRRNVEIAQRIHDRILFGSGAVEPRTQVIIIPRI